MHLVILGSLLCPGLPSVQWPISCVNSTLESPPRRSLHESADWLRHRAISSTEECWSILASQVFQMPNEDHFHSPVNSVWLCAVQLSSMRVSLLLTWIALHFALSHYTHNVPSASWKTIMFPLHLRTGHALFVIKMTLLWFSFCLLHLQAELGQMEPLILYCGTVILPFLTPRA